MLLLPFEEDKQVKNKSSNLNSLEFPPSPSSSSTNNEDSCTGWKGKLFFLFIHDDFIFACILGWLNDYHIS